MQPDNELQDEMFRRTIELIEIIRSDVKYILKKVDELGMSFFDPAVSVPTSFLDWELSELRYVATLVAELQFVNLGLARSLDPVLVLNVVHAVESRNIISVKNSCDLLEVSLRGFESALRNLQSFAATAVSAKELAILGLGKGDQSTQKLIRDAIIAHLGVAGDHVYPKTGSNGCKLYFYAKVVVALRLVKSGKLADISWPDRHPQQTPKRDSKEFQQNNFGKKRQGVDVQSLEQDGI